MTNDIGHGIALIVPVMTLDTLVGTLVIGVGTLTGVHKLGFMCLFGCLSVVANYLAFMTLYPACLSIGVQVIHTCLIMLLLCCVVVANIRVHVRCMTVFMSLCFFSILDAEGQDKRNCPETCK